MSTQTAPRTTERRAPATSGPAQRAVTALLVDPDVRFRLDLRATLLAQGVAVVAEASTARDAVRLAAEVLPDVVVMDIDAELAEGLEATRGFCASLAGPEVIALASQESPAALDVILAGARGFLLKGVDYDQIAMSVTLVAEGTSALSPVVAGRLLHRMRELEGEHRRYSSDRLRAALSPRERDVLLLLAAGRSNGDIGEALYLSVSCVKQHIAAIVTKLGVDNRVQAAVAAVRMGLA